MFPKWANQAAKGVLLAVVGLPLYVGLLLGYGAHPSTLNVGYEPVQPVPYSHALHVGKLGLDCRYCHTTVEHAAMAALPPTDVCMNCHHALLPNSPRLGEVRKSYVEGTPVRWVKVHDLAEYVYFNHSAHVTAGVGCAECHGPVQQMAAVRTVAPLNMAWCLECHRSPEAHLRPRDQVTNMEWGSQGDSPIFVERKLGQSPGASAREALGKGLREKYHVNPNTDCVTCHR
jgi:formate-dependent nitrite reductase cytochrome c552 subunit